jgi:hypothetical protein
MGVFTTAAIFAVKKRFGHVAFSLKHWQQEALVSCSKHHWQHALFSNISMPLSSTQSEGLQLRAYHMPSLVNATFIDFLLNWFLAMSINSSLSVINRTAHIRHQCRKTTA